MAFGELEWLDDSDIDDFEEHIDDEIEDIIYEEVIEEAEENMGEVPDEIISEEDGLVDLAKAIAIGGLLGLVYGDRKEEKPEGEDNYEEEFHVEIEKNRGLRALYYEDPELAMMIYKSARKDAEKAKERVRRKKWQS